VATYKASITAMTPLPFSPFIDETEIDEANRFVPNENALFDAIRADTDRWPFLDWPVWSPAEDPPPLFLSDPSPEFIAAMHRDLMPLLERAARLG
jgi:hypothetical protein